MHTFISVWKQFQFSNISAHNKTTMGKISGVFTLILTTDLLPPAEAIIKRSGRDLWPLVNFHAAKFLLYRTEIASVDEVE